MGALLLHRLSQSAAGLPQGLHGSPRQLGIRGQDVRRGDEVIPSPVAIATSIPALPSKEMAASPVFDRLAVAVLCLVSALALLTFRDYGLSWDDYVHSEYGDLLLEFYASGFRDRRAL